MSLERNSAGKFAKSVFFDEINDIDIYVEDTARGYEKLLSTIFSRLFNGKYKVEKVFPIGSRGEVENKYHECISTITKPTLFVVDGDLYLLTGEPLQNKNGFFRFPFYCFENLLCFSDSILEILNEEDAINHQEHIIEKFNFNDWLIKNEEKLFSLFIEYGIVKTLKPQIQTVAYNVKELINDKYGNLSDIKTQERISNLSVQIKDEFGEERYSMIRNEIIQRFNSSSCNKLDVVSGKDYIFPLFKLRARSTVKTSMSDLNFKLRLSCKVNLEKISQAQDYVAIPPAS